MPYIKAEQRVELDKWDTIPDNAGELNYMVTRLIHEYWEENGSNYQAFNDIVGALECAKLELYRRWIGPYEDVKIAENGDVE